MQESTFDKIARKTGKKPVECKCQKCKSQCQAPCKGTPEDMAKIMARYPEGRVQIGDFKGVTIITPLFDPVKKACTFFNNGLCDLHEEGLKPTEGKLSHHSTETFVWKKSLTFWILKEWEHLKPETLKVLLQKYQSP